MAHPDRELSLLTCIIEQLKKTSLTRDVVGKCYYATQPADSTESGETSEEWISLIYENLLEVDHQELLDAQHSRPKMGDILHRIIP